MFNQSAPVIYNVTNYEATRSQGSRQVDCKCYMDRAITLSQKKMICAVLDA